KASRGGASPAPANPPAASARPAAAGGSPAADQAVVAGDLAPRPAYDSPAAKPPHDSPAAAKPPASAPEPAEPAPIETSGPAALETGGILTIDLAAIVKNWKAMANRVVPADFAGVIKADAYGCRIGHVACVPPNAVWVTI